MVVLVMTKEILGVDNAHYSQIPANRTQIPANRTQIPANRTRNKANRTRNKANRTRNKAPDTGCGKLQIQGAASSRYRVRQLQGSMRSGSNADAGVCDRPRVQQMCTFWRHFAVLTSFSGQGHI